MAFQYVPLETYVPTVANAKMTLPDLTVIQDQSGWSTATLI